MLSNQISTIAPNLKQDSNFKKHKTKCTGLMLFCLFQGQNLPNMVSQDELPVLQQPKSVDVLDRLEARRSQESVIAPALLAESHCPCRRHWSPMEEEIARKLIHRLSEPCCLIACCRLPDCFYDRHTIHLIYFCATAWLCLITLCVVLVGFMLCGQCMRTLHFMQSHCAVTHISSNESATCRWQEVACIKVWVRYTTQNGNNVTSQLYDTVDEFLTRNTKVCYYKYVILLYPDTEVYTLYL